MNHAASHLARLSMALVISFFVLGCAANPTPHPGSGGGDTGGQETGGETPSTGGDTGATGDTGTGAGDDTGGGDTGNAGGGDTGGDADAIDDQDAVGGAGDADVDEPCDPETQHDFCCCDLDALTDPICVDGQWACPGIYEEWDLESCNEPCGPCWWFCDDDAHAGEGPTMDSVSDDAGPTPADDAGPMDDIGAP